LRAEVPVHDCSGPLGRITAAGPAKGAFCGFRLFFKSIRTATACLAGRLWVGLYGNVAKIATSMLNLGNTLHQPL
jgi:hypothetical protein